MNLLSSVYYCKKCQHNHKTSSKIGKEHLMHKKIIIKRIKPDQNIFRLQEKQSYIQKQKISNEVKTTDLVKETFIENLSEDKTEPRSNVLAKQIRDYQKSYQKGTDSYGVWWKIFQISVWSIIMIFILVASITFIVFLPKIEFINWVLQ